tara:strand:+ start:1390 stop:2376 length:987 start_codon:yes stop_codon:yes gene_type:complete
MDYKQYILPTIVFLTVAFIYENFKQYNDDDENAKHYKLVEKYLLNSSSLARSKKPILWIHTDRETNARWWASWGSRNTNCMNQPYLFLTIKSIIDKCGGQFNICLIDDSSFESIIPGWNVNMEKIADPIKDKMRNLAMARVLKSYGGMFVPSSFICFRSLIEVYKTGIKNTGMFVGELDLRDGKGPPRSQPYQNLACPSPYFMGCVKDSSKMSEYRDFLLKMISKDFTAESIFLGEVSEWLAYNVDKGEINVIPAEILGSRDIKNKLITIEQLMGNSYIDVSPNAIGVYLPDKDILRRTKYQWFARLSATQVVASDTMAGKILMLANS